MCFSDMLTLCGRHLTMFDSYIVLQLPHTEMQYEVFNYR